MVWSYGSFFLKFNPKGGLRVLYKPQYLNKKMNRVSPFILVVHGGCTTVNRGAD